MASFWTELSLLRIVTALAVVAVVVLAGGAVWGLVSRRSGSGDELTVRTPCPGSPNCVSSLASGAAAIEPLAFEGDPDEAWATLVTLIEARASKIVRRDATALHAVFDSGVFGFRDDLLLELDRAERRIDVRSSSRVGYSDLGANRKRVEELRAAFARR